MGITGILLIIVSVIWWLLARSEMARIILFAGVVAILALIGSLIIPVLRYISCAAILIMLFLIGAAVFKALFR